MDFQSIVDSVYVPTIIVSVEKREEGGYGEIRIVAGNKKYAVLFRFLLFPGDLLEPGAGGDLQDVPDDRDLAELSLV